MPEELVMHLQSEYTHAWAVLGCAGHTEHIPGWAVPHIPCPWEKLSRMLQPMAAPTQAHQLYHLCGLACF